MDTAFRADTAVTPVGGGVYDVRVAPGWKAGRGPHGGYLAAMILRALMAAVAEPERAPRSLTIHFARAPAFGPARIRTTIERAGRSLTTVSAQLEQDGEVQALALAAFARPWEGRPELDDHPIPDVAAPDPRATEAMPDDVGLPRFTSHLVMQPRFGPWPFTGTAEPMVSGGWLGLFESQPLDAPALALFSDAWWSPPFGRLTEPATSPTIDLTIHFRRPATELDPEALCLARFSTGLVHDGFFENDALIWSPDGRLLAQARQLALLLPRSVASPNQPPAA
jgi:acyl-CoA thioesterase